MNSRETLAKNLRLIPRLDIKGPNLIKSVQLEGLRVLGNPKDFANRYYQEGADELLLMDSVASLYGRNNLTSLISEVAKDIFIPVTVGGGIRSLEDASEALLSGADKVAVNTGAVENPNLIHALSRRFGSQSIVLSIDAKLINNEWEVLTEMGRQKTNLSVKKWVAIGAELGAGEILLTSIDREGTRTGFDLKLITEIAAMVRVPIIVSGGMGKLEDLLSVAPLADGVAIADLLHYQRTSLRQVRDFAITHKLPVRNHGQ